MYWRKIILILFFIPLFANNVKDELILEAMLNENTNSEISSKAYKKLYELTNLQGYLEESIKQGLMSNSNVESEIEKLRKIDDKSELITKIDIINLIEKKDYKKALKEYEKYIKTNDDLALAAAMYKEYNTQGLKKESFKIAKDYYKLYENPYSLYIYLEALMNDKKYKEVVKLTDEMNEIAEQNNKAEEEIIPYLVLRANALKELKQYEKLLKLDPQYFLEHIQDLEKNKKYKEILKLTKNIELSKEYAPFLVYRANAIYELRKSTYMSEMNELCNYLDEISDNPIFLNTLVDYLFYFNKKQELYELAKKNNSLEYAIFYRLKEYKKLSEKLYKLAIEKSDNALLIESYLFEFMHNPKEFDYFKLDELIAKGGASANVLNTYAYILIDEKINIEKGIDIAKIAVQAYPDNGYFLDTLAWGYYLIKDCENAKKIMQKALQDSNAANEDDIKNHEKKINKCKK